MNINLKTEAALIIGVAVAVLNALITVIGAGDFDDGLQWEDLIPILLPILGALGIRQNVYSAQSVQTLTRGNVTPPPKAERPDSLR